MASDMTAPSRVIRSASHRGTWPPWRGKSALPARRVITLMCLLEFAGRQTGPFMLCTMAGESGQLGNELRRQSLKEGRTCLSRHRRRLPMTAAYFAKLNTEQRRAVEHGCDALDEAPPLLIIAGAGSGKTNTLANRVAHLIVSGAAPRRMMLLPFSRRAAAEMQRRVERITAEVLGAKAGSVTDALSWSGTFHAVGARLLRAY